MNNEERILQLLEAQQQELRKLNSKMDAMQADISQLKEDSEITRAGVNALLEWAEECGNVIKFPLPKVK
mgnify:CR=1 FL=1